MNATLARLNDAVNRHDPEAMAALFAPDYRSEQPVHPERGFGGPDRVAADWRQMFDGVPT
jgi:SnoaL-like domain